ncbi:MAG: GGDEF domain-containing protein, partial [Brevundimonas sp.]
MSRTEDQDPVALVAEIERLRFDMEALRQRAERAEALADHDVLTPALNRRGFVNVLTRQMAYCHRHQQ